MIDSHKYWILHGVNSFNSSHQSVEVAEARDFFMQYFQQLIQQNTEVNREIQVQLFHYKNHGTIQEQKTAILCLKCFVSHCIYHICLKTEQKYRENYGLSRSDLFPIVLDSLKQKEVPLNLNCDSLANEIINTFDLNKNSNLSTWTNIKIKGNRDYKKILKFYNIVEITDWLLLTKTTLGALERKLKHQLYSDFEIKKYGKVLAAFHQVYSSDLIINRKTKNNKPYPKPTKSQLLKIALISHPESNLEDRDILDKLKKIALILRANIISKRPNLTVAKSKNSPTNQNLILLLQKQIELNLSTITNRIIKNRINYFLDRKKPQKLKANNFILGLKLFHCNNYSMGKIASILNLSSQYQISRLFKLKELREDISRNAIAFLKTNFRKQIDSLIFDTTQLSNLDDAIQEFIESEITEIMNEAYRETLNSQNRNRNSLFARIVCQCVQKIGIEQ